MTMVLLKEQATAILSRFPFELNQVQIDSVVKVIEQLSLEQKLARLINLQVFPESINLDEIAAFQPGAITLIGFQDPSQCQSLIQSVKSFYSLPPLFCADIEGGATSGGLTSPLPNQLGCAAANSPKLYASGIESIANELSKIGINWTFTPVLDQASAFRSAIVGTRSFGNDTNQIRNLATIHINKMQSRKIAATAKHWPGEGYDERDQHLLTTINPLQMDQWRNYFGDLFASSISAGVLSIMSAHIALPAYAQAKGITGLEAYRPASISNLFNQELLRNELGFNGVIVSDATLMGGLESWGPRAHWLAQLVQNGCDMILFTQSIANDLAILSRAFKHGQLSSERIDSSLIRTLGMTAKLDLLDTDELSVQSAPVVGGSIVVRPSQEQADLRELARRSPTLVKDVQNLLPLNRELHRRVLLIQSEDKAPLAGALAYELKLAQYFNDYGFEATVFEPGLMQFEQFRQFDLIVYVLSQESLLTKSRIYMNWVQLHGSALAAMQRTWFVKLTLLISFGHPFYLFDAPRMPCVINAYCALESVQQAVVEKLLGLSAFEGVSPVDAFCGLEDAHY
jgi:beta-N-acetylhexosaminidase